MPGERDGAGRVADDEQRRDRGEDQRRHRRVRPQHQHLRRAEDGVGRPGRRSSCRGRSPGAARPARRRPCPGARGSRPARRPPPRRDAATPGGRCRSHVTPGAQRASTPCVASVTDLGRRAGRCPGRRRPDRRSTRHEPGGARRRSGCLRARGAGAHGPRPALADPVPPRRGVPAAVEAVDLPRRSHHDHTGDDQTTAKRRPNDGKGRWSHLHAPDPTLGP